jgi:hypothetical protein
LNEKRAAETSASSTNKVARGPELKDLILKKQDAHRVTFHDQSDFVFEGVPGHLMDSLQEYNEEAAEGKMTIDHVPNKHIKITIPSGDEEVPDTVVKVTF